MVATVVHVADDTCSATVEPGSDASDLTCATTGDPGGTITGDIDSVTASAGTGIAAAACETAPPTVATSDSHRTARRSMLTSDAAGAELPPDRPAGRALLDDTVRRHLREQQLEGRTFERLLRFELLRKCAPLRLGSS